MSAAISRNKGGDDRVQFVPLQLLLLGPLLAPVWIAGWVRLFRAQHWRPVRALAWAYPVVSLIVLVTGGQPHYPAGLVLALLAAGTVVVEQARHRWPRWAAWIAAAVTVPTSILLALPVVPVRALPPAVIAINPAADRRVAVLVTANYGEAGALDRFGGPYGLPTVHSGHNELFTFGPPPDSATTVVFVGMEDIAGSGWFADCATVGHLDNGLGVDNEEQGRSITVCHVPSRPWHELWPRFQHYD